LGVHHSAFVIDFGHALRKCATSVERRLETSEAECTKREELRDL
jgi:hypothetical protein